MAFQPARRSYTFDIAMQFKDAALVAASANAQVGGIDKIIDLNGDTFIKGVMVIDVSAIEIGTGDELYGIVLQGSNSSTFASGIENLASLGLGATAVRAGGAQDSTAGRYEMPFMNVQNGAQYRYLRLYTKVSGTIATGINYTAFAGLDMC